MIHTLIHCLSDASFKNNTHLIAARLNNGCIVYVHKRRPVRLLDLSENKGQNIQNLIVLVSKRQIKTMNPVMRFKSFDFSFLSHFLKN